ncbi:MAG TPA: hypothetical protein VI076_13205, partial [Actinopolymorphaceae bacterium]
PSAAPRSRAGEDAGYFRNWAQVRQAALDAGIPPWIFVQSLGMDGGKAIPTKADLLWQINVSLAYGCKGIQYVTYWTPDPARGGGYTGALLTADGKRTKLYRAAKLINNNYLSEVGKVLLPMRPAMVQAANLTDPPEGLPADEYLRDATGDPVVLGAPSRKRTHPARGGCWSRTTPGTRARPYG